MYKHTLKKLPKNTLEITVDINASEMSKHFDASFKKMAADLTVEGFRKGKAPEALAKKHIKRESVYQEAVRAVLPGIYDEIVKTESLKPIISPQITLLKAKDGEDWQFSIKVAEAPTIDLKDYKKAVSDVNKESKKEPIWVPGQDEVKKEKAPEVASQEQINAALDMLLKTAEVEISELVIEEELEARLARLVDDVQKLGLTVEAYLKSKNLTLDTLKEQYKKEIEDVYKVEFLLQKIADSESITVTEADVDALLANIPDKVEKERAKAQSYYYASLIRKQKVLEYLAAL